MQSRGFYRRDKLLGLGSLIVTLVSEATLGTGGHNHP